VILIFISCAWIAGIFLGSKLDLPLPLLLAGLVPLLLLFFTRRRKPVILLCTGIILLVVAAVYSFSSLNTIDENCLHFYNDRGISEMKGTVAADPDVRDSSTRLLVSVDEIRFEGGWRQVDGKALVFVPRYPGYEYGDVLKLTGEAATPQPLEGFDYKGYLAHQGIYTVVYYPSVKLLDTEQGFRPLAWIYSLRHGLAENIAEALPEPQASLAQGIILGIRGNIPAELNENFAVSGTAHLLAISGLHLGIIAGILLAAGIWIFGKRHYLYVWLAIGAIWFYVLITGVHMPVLRGAVMATVFLLAELLGRQRNSIAALTFAAAIMVGVNPYVLGDASFQLSFLAMAGLVFIFPILRESGSRITRRISGEKSQALPLANFAVDAMSATLGALIAVWPVIAYYFGIVSLVGPLTTLLALPALPMVIVFGALAGIAGFASIFVAQGFGWLAWFFLSYILMVVNGLASSTLSAIEVGPLSPVFLWIYYAVLAAAIWVYGNRRRLFGNRSRELVKSIVYVPLRLPRKTKWVLIPLTAATVLMIYNTATMPDDKLHVSFLDVGEGDAVLIRKGSQQILIDGGPSPQAIGLELGEQMPYWDRSIDLLVLTHPHSDHMAGLVEVVRRSRVERIMQPDCYFESPLYGEWQRIVAEKGIDVTIARAGQVIDMGDGVIIEVLNPAPTYAAAEASDLDNNSVVLRLTAHEISFLLTGDIMRETEWEMVRQGLGLKSTVLKVAHHGSDTSTTSEFLAAVDPGAAVISCGSDNKYGHPDEEVIFRLRQKVRPEQVFVTSANGTIEFITDGERLWVEVGK
jgi:competence protein ComEC